MGGVTKSQLAAIRDLKVSEAIKKTAVKAVNDWKVINLNRLIK